jgi:glutamine synthetase
MTTMAVQEFLQQHSVRCVLAQFVDIHGTAKAKAVPVEHLGMVLGNGAGFAGFAMWGFGMGPHGPDYMAVGDTASLRILPWLPGYARIVCDGYVKGSPYPFCSRVVLKQQLARLSARGLTLYTGIEPEFMLLARAADGSLVPNDGSDALEKPCYDYKGLARAARVLDQIVTSLRTAGIDVYQIDHEDANGQFEVNFTYADALRTADDFTFVKMAVSEVARAHNMIGTFMPKPFSDRTGSGAHFHVSLGDTETNNLFHDPRDLRGLQLSPVAYHFLGAFSTMRAHSRRFVRPPSTPTSAWSWAAPCRVRPGHRPISRTVTTIAPRVCAFPAVVWSCACRTRAAIPIW